MGYNDIFSLVSNAIQSLMGTQLNSFVSDGQVLFNVFAVVLILIYGMRIALSPDTLNGADALQLVTQLVIGKIITYYYAAAIPGLGVSFTGIIIKECTFLTSQIGASQYDLLQQAANDVLSKLPPASITDLTQDAIYLMFSVTVSLIKAVVFLVASFGFIMQSLLLLFGPLFTPFYIVPQLDFLAWNWFKCFLQYSFYGVLGNGYAYILSSIAIAMFKQIGIAITQPNANSLTALGGLFWLLIAAICGLVIIPSLVSHLFSGQSGSSALPGGSKIASALAS